MEIIFLKFLVIFLMSFFFGLERQFSNKPIGFGTFIFVATRACALGAVSTALSPLDPLVIAGGVVTGIGFLGAGALIKTSDKIFGFTTAASIWVFAIVGLCIGLDQYFIGTLTYLVIWAVVLTDRILEFNGIGSYQRKLSFKTNRIMDKGEIVSLFKNHKWKLLSFKVDNLNKGSKISYLINGPRSYVNTLKETLVKQPWIEEFSIE